MPCLSLRNIQLQIGHKKYADNVDIAYETKQITFFKSLPKWRSDLYGINYQFDNHEASKQ